MAKKKPVLCTNCGGEVTATPAAPKARGESRAIRVALYSRYQALGFQICPTCKDYVNVTAHNCEVYRTIWFVTASMDHFGSAMASIGAELDRTVRIDDDVAEAA